MGKIRRDVREEFDNMSEDEILAEFNTYITIEFTINHVKFIFRNVDEGFLKDFSIVNFIKMIELDTTWYSYSFYDSVFVNGMYFMITEFSKKKIVLVRGN